MTRAVARNRTTTIRMGMIVHASSICVLPYTWAGSRSWFAEFARNLEIEYTSKVKTTRKMIPVIESTNLDKSTIDFAGVDSGENTLGERARSARAAGGNKMQDRANMASCLAARIVIDFAVGRIGFDLL